MTQKDEALKMAIEAIKTHVPHYVLEKGYAPLEAYKAALSEPEQDSGEAVAWLINWDNKEWFVTKENEDVETAKAYNWEMKPLYTSPPKQDSGEAVAILHRKTLEVYSPKLTVHHKADITFIKQNESDLDSDMKYMLLADGDYNLYTSPPKREWRGLTTGMIDEIYQENLDDYEFAVAIEAKLKELNHD